MMSIGPQHIDKYELQEILGRGAMGEVWKAFDTELRRYVAIKFLHAHLQNDTDFMTRFHREAQIVASLHHPNIIQIYDAHLLPSKSDEARAYMVMDYVEGQTLDDYIRSTSRRWKFPPGADIVSLFTSISLAIDYAHQNGLIHRDIKPANILLDKRNTARNPMGEPILTDFGLVKLVGTPTGALTNASLGTPLYISPEQAQGHTGNERSDIYSLGVILYEICTGIPPFRGENNTAIMMQHIMAMPNSPALINQNIPPALTVVILRCLEKDPARRFPSASSLTAALAEAFSLPVPETLNQPAYPPDTRDRPTYYKPVQSDGSPPPGITPSSQSSPNVPVGRSTPQIVSSSSVKQASSESGGIPIAPSIQTPISMVPLQSPPGAAPPALSPTPAFSKRPRGLLVTLIAILIIVLVSSGVSALLVLHPWSPINPSTQPVGHAFFISSGQLDLTQKDSPGLNDELQIDLQNVPNPAPGKSYYAWLLKDTETERLIPLGSLHVNQGQMYSLLYSDNQHRNLLAIASHLLITEEDTNSMPSHPSLDKIVYRADLPQNHFINGFTILGHFRHLLSGDLVLDKKGLYGGLGIWLLTNTAKVWGWAGNARDYWNGKSTDTGYIDGQIKHILDCLENAGLDLRDARIASVALIDTPNKTPPDYVTHIILHLDSIALAQDATSDLRARSSRIENAISNVRKWLELVKKDANTLFEMTNPPTINPQLFQPATLTTLNDMETQANYAYNGQIDPSTGKVLQEGVAQIYLDMQRLATFDVMPYTS